MSDSEPPVDGWCWHRCWPAGAVDWQILYRLSEDLRVLRPDPDSGGFSSRASRGDDITASTPTAEWGITGDVGHLVFFGGGPPEDRSRSTVAAATDLLKTTRSTDFNLNAHFSMAPATGTVLLDLLLLQVSLRVSIRSRHWSMNLLDQLLHRKIQRVLDFGPFPSANPTPSNALRSPRSA